MAVPDVTDPLNPILQDVRDFLHARVNLGLPAGHVDETTTLIVNGLESVIDHCCPGLAWVRVVNAFPTTNFPQPATTNVGCPDTLFGAQLELGIARCSCVPDENGDMSVECLDEEAIQAGLDRSALFQVAICDLAGYFDCHFNLGLWNPLAIEGGCFGGVLTITVPYDMCCDPIGE